MTELQPVPEVGEHPEHLFRFLQDNTAQGVRCALITIAGIVDSASRNLGSHMVVTEGGKYAGSVSSGCVDANVAQAALKALHTGQRARLQLGAGSAFVDIRLPCGGGLDLLIVPDPDPGIISRLVESLEQRQPCGLRFTPAALEYLGSAAAADAPSPEEVFAVRYTPNLKLVLAGRGPELTHFCTIARAGGFSVAAYSPDPVDVAVCGSQGAWSTQLKAPQADCAFDTDPWTAVVLLFHDHDWEAGLLEAALAGDAFYIGALGSRKTHATRIEMMRGRGADSANLARIHGPVGLVPSMRNAPMLAISVLAEIIDQFNRAHS